MLEQEGTVIHVSVSPSNDQSRVHVRRGAATLQHVQHQIALLTLADIELVPLQGCNTAGGPLCRSFASAFGGLSTERAVTPHSLD